MAEVRTPSGLILPNGEPPYLIADERIEVSPLERSVTIDGGPPENITMVEFDVLAYLASQPDVTVAPEDLTKAVWGTANEQTWESARSHLRRIRGKLGPELGDQNTGAIITRWTLGYCAVSSLSGNTLQASDEDKFSYFLADERVAVQPFELTVKEDGRLLSTITETEFNILLTLARHTDETVSLPALVEDVWGYDDDGTRLSARVYISRLRKKFSPELSHAKNGVIRTDFGLGYYAVSSLTDGPE